MQLPSSLLKKVITKKYVLLPAKMEGTINHHYADINNNQLTQNELGKLRVIVKFNYKNKHFKEILA